MDSIIRKNARGDSLVHYSDFQKLTKTAGKWYDFQKLYFFFDSELKLKETRDPVVYSQMKKDIRHLIPYKGHYYDYTVHKEYSTLREWAEDSGKNVSNIVYGVNRIHLKHSWQDRVTVYISLGALIKFLDPKYQSEPVVEVSDKEMLLVQIDLMMNQMDELRAKIEKLK